MQNWLSENTQDVGFSKKLKIELLFDPAISLLDIDPN